MGLFAPDSLVVFKDVEVCRSGTWNNVTLTDDDLRRVPGVYDPEKCEECVVVLDHDKRGPSFGLVRKFRFDEARRALVASELAVKPDVAREMLPGGKYSRRSMWLSPNVKDVDGYYPRHLSLLGAAPPAVRGLAPITPDQAVMLAQDADGDIEIYLSCEEDSQEPTQEVTMAEKDTRPGEVELADLVARTGKLELELAEERKLRKDAEDRASKADANEVLLAELRTKSLRGDAKDILDAKDTGTNMTPALKRVLTEAMFAALVNPGEVMLSDEDGNIAKGTMQDALIRVIDALPKDISPQAAKGAGGLKVMPRATEDFELSDQQITIMKAQGYKPGTEKWEQQVKLYKDSVRELQLREAS